MFIPLLSPIALKIAILYSEIKKQKKKEQKENELKPCPFCANRKIKIRGGEHYGFYAICFSCWAQVGPKVDRDAAISDWNMREGKE